MPRTLPTSFTAAGPPADTADELVAAVRAGLADELVPFAGQTVGLIDAIIGARRDRRTGHWGADDPGLRFRRRAAGVARSHEAPGPRH